MITKTAHILALCFAILACLPTFNFQQLGPGPVTGGALHPFASSPYYDPTVPDSRRQLTIDERINGTGSTPQGGAGLAWSWGF